MIIHLTNIKINSWVIKSSVMKALLKPLKPCCKHCCHGYIWRSCNLVLCTRLQEPSNVSMAAMFATRFEWFQKGFHPIFHNSYISAKLVWRLFSFFIQQEQNFTCGLFCNSIGFELGLSWTEGSKQSLFLVFHIAKCNYGVA